MRNRVLTCPAEFAELSAHNSEFLGIALRSCGVRPRAPPNPTIREFTVELARIAGSRASKRQPLPGVLKLWAAWTIFAPQLLVYRTLKEEGRIKESSAVN